MACLLIWVRPYMCQRLRNFWQLRQLPELVAAGNTGPSSPCSTCPRNQFKILHTLLTQPGETLGLGPLAWDHLRLKWMRMFHPLDTQQQVRRAHGMLRHI